MKSAPLNSELEVVYKLPHQEVEVESRDVQVISRLRLLWSHRRFLAKSATWWLIAGLAVAFLIPARYDSTLRIMPPDDQSGSALAMAAALGGRLPGGLGGIAGDVLGLKSSGALFTGILTSRTVQDHLITKFDLRAVYGVRTWYAARKRLARNTSISEDRRNGIITITVSDHDPQRAAAISEEYASELRDVVSQLGSSSARRERLFLEGRIQQVQQDLESAEKEFGDFASKNTAVDIKEQARAMVGAAATLQGQLIAAQSQLEGLRQIYADDHVRVRSLRAHVAELQAQLAKLGGKYESPSDPNKSQDESLYPSIRKLPVLGEAFADLYRRTRVQEAVFETLTQQYELAKVAEAKETLSVKVLDSADIPEHKSFPPRLVIIVLFLFVGFVLSAVWIELKTRWQKSSSQGPYKAFAQEVIQSANEYMPWAPPNGSRLQSMTHSMWIRLTSKSRSLNEQNTPRE